ncbi:transketolase [Runella slithyformis]|uniref:Transketolase central region n=1 Tax=Runella slithyformis (strain ATCC 29530 / DSM 19594 / LMG 11500 / NCIMB 11436 / LSU 4) TaxID=761193 RepID=A0A7U4E759_RUNSL|nr:transketolase [Runella slithyformis]AEI50321.1 Transketolase central region [Runella slithyformis DSM 19594]
MRKEFSAAIEKLALADESIVFITGDLGYNALENLQYKLGKRFINAGVAEQNMVGVAAGMAYKGYKVFCYSIAPFVVYRCLEQFRNDACLHNLPVFLVGNGGGYGYGIMGSTHHAIEDLACLSSLQNVKTWIPAFSDEVEPVLTQVVHEKRPAYVRLGVGPLTPAGATLAGSLKKVITTPNAPTTIIALGPIAANVLKALQESDLKEECSLYTSLTLPLQLANETINELRRAENILVVEEHVSIGGLAQQLSVRLLEAGIHPQRFQSLSAQGYPNGRYGSQHYHQAQSGLDVKNIINVLRSFSESSLSNSTPPLR